MIKKISVLIALIGCTLTTYSQLPATWSVNPASFNYSMTLTTYINNDCVELADPNNAVAAFVGTQCRGYAYTNVDGSGHKLAFVTIYSNTAANEVVQLRFFKASTAQELTALDGFTFLSDAIKGSVANPFVTTTNHRPTAIAVSNLTVQENTAIGGFIGSCSGTDQDTGQILTFSLPAGALENNRFQLNSGNLVLNTVLNYAVQSTYQVSIEVNDGVGCTYIDTFTVRVDDHAFAPVATNDIATLNEDANRAVNVLVNDTDYDNDIDVSSVQVIGGPNHGTATVATGVITYTPNPDYFGPDTLIYSVCDLTNTGALCDTAKVFITVNAVPDPPVANRDVVSTLEDTFVNINVLSNDTDVENDINPASVQVTVNPLHGTTTVTSGVIKYVPDANYFGTDTLTYSVCDLTSPTPLCDTARVIITIISVPDKPVAVNDAVTLSEDGTADIHVLTNDSDNDNDIDVSSVHVINGPNHGTITVTNGVITYTPTINYNGQDTLVYVECDLTGLCDTAQVFIVVTAIPNPPIANLDTISTPEEAPVNITVISNDTDVENDINPASVQVTAGPAHGTATITAGVIHYVPDFAFNGTDTLVYSVCDLTSPTPLCDTALVIITVIPVPDTPDNILIDTLTVLEDNAPNTLISHIYTIDTDLPADSFTYELVTGNNDNDNAQFTIIGNQLIITTHTIYEIKNLYHIRVRSTDAFALSIEREFDIHVIDQTGNKIALPASTYISNNGDGKNDFFTVENVAIYNAFSLAVFDQFGKRVYFREENYNNDFDGRVNDEPLPSGAYYYVFESKEVTYSGNITIVN